MKSHHAVYVVAIALALVTSCSRGNSVTSQPASTTASAQAAISYADEGRVCASLNALEFAGNGKASAYSTVEKALSVTSAQVAKARYDRCPKI